MKNETFKEAFSSVTASDDMVNKAMQIPEENEIRPSFSGWQVARRVAAAAAIVAVLIGAMVLPGPPVTFCFSRCRTITDCYNFNFMFNN